MDKENTGEANPLALLCLRHMIKNLDWLNGEDLTDKQRHLLAGATEALRRLSKSFEG